MNWNWTTSLKTPKLFIKYFQHNLVCHHRSLFVYYLNKKIKESLTLLILKTLNIVDTNKILRTFIPLIYDPFSYMMCSVYLKKQFQDIYLGKKCKYFVDRKKLCRIVSSSTVVSFFYTISF